MTEDFLQVFKKYCLSELNTFSDYIKHSNKGILDAQNQFEEQLKTIEQGQVKIIIGEEQREEYVKLNSIFPNFFRLTTFVGLFFSFENKLTSLCNYIHERKQFKLRISDLSGENIIERSRRYLNLVVGIDLDDLNQEWVKITDYQKIRNCFVHNNSNIIKDKNKKVEEQMLFTLINKYPFLKLTPYGLIYITNDDFLIDFTQLQMNFLSKLIDKADPKFR